MTYFLKISTLLLLLIHVTGIYGQDVDRELLLRNHSAPLLQSEEGFDKGDFENHWSQILKTAVFDSTSVVDSVIVTKADGAKEKHIYTYDTNGNKTSKLSEDWDGSQWMNSYRHTYTYDSIGNKIMYLIENWDSSKWVNTRRETYTYNLSGNKTFYLIEKWDVNQFANFEQKTYTYDSNGNRTSELYEHWHSTNWENERRNTYTYNLDGSMTLELEEGWNGSQWFNAIRYTFAYDSNGNMILDLREDSYGSGWENILQKTYTYDLNGNRSSYLREDWIDSQWENYWRETYTYDSNGNRTSFIFQRWDDTQWMNWARVNYSYDLNGNITLYFEEMWYDTEWKNSVTYTYTYDSDGNLIVGTCDGLGIDGRYPINGIFRFSDTFGNSFSVIGSEINVLYGTLTDVEEPDLSVSDYYLSQNYPNPFNPSTTIKYSIPSVETHGHASVQLVVYDILGREVATLVNKKQKAGNYEVQFDASNLTSGIYFYKLQSGNFVESRKMLLLR